MAESGSTASRTPRSSRGSASLAWRALPPERQLAAVAALALFATLFLPWYQETVIPTGFGVKTALPSASLTGWAAFSFVEAAVLLVSLAVLTLLFTRAEGRAFHVPGGDGGVITGAGFWTGVLILWRMFDKSGTDGHGQFVTTSGIEWGIFIALGVSGLLAYAGQRIRLLHTPEPPLPGEPRAPRPARSWPARASRPGADAPAAPTERARCRLGDPGSHTPPGTAARLRSRRSPGPRRTLRLVPRASLGRQPGRCPGDRVRRSARGRRPSGASPPPTSS